MQENAPQEVQGMEFGEAEEEARYLVREVINLAAQNAPTTEVEDAIVALYARLRPEFEARELALNLLVQLYATFGKPENPYDPKDELESLASEITYSPIVRRTDEGDIFLDRRESIRNIADRLTGAARLPIETAEIVKELRALGDKDADRSLAIAIGNVLNRAGWQRISSGVYAPPRRAGARRGAGRR